MNYSSAIVLDPYRLKSDFVTGYEFGRMSWSNTKWAHESRRELKGRLEVLSVEAANSRLITEIELGLVDSSSEMAMGDETEEINLPASAAGEGSGLFTERPAATIHYTESTSDFKPKKINHAIRQRIKCNWKDLLIMSSHFLMTRLLSKPKYM